MTENSQLGEPATAAPVTPSPTGDAASLENHSAQAAATYAAQRRFYEDLAAATEAVVSITLDDGGVQVHSIESRAKTVDSLRKKASRPADDDPDVPKYSEPLRQIQDLAGVRVITFFLNTVQEAVTTLEREFTVIEKTNRSSLVEPEAKLGYQSFHLIVEFNELRSSLPEYSRYSGHPIEIQVRTILQHAWAEIEHDIQYKSVEALPSATRRRFMSLAGLIEIADREFQSLAEEDERARNDNKRLIAEGSIENVEITADSLKAYLDRRYGPDGRMREWSYAYAVKLLRALGFQNLGQLNECIAPYNDDAVSRAVWGSRQGQLQRLEDVVMVAMADNEEYWERHIYGPWYREAGERRVGLAESQGITRGGFRPGQL